MSHRQMKEELTCPICMELFCQPRRLPCGHSYCHKCLSAILVSGSYSYTRRLACPECREEANLSYGKGVEEIPLDFKLSKLVDLFKFMKRNDGSDSSGDEQACSSHHGSGTHHPHAGKGGATATSTHESETFVREESSSSQQSTQQPTTLGAPPTHQQISTPSNSHYNTSSSESNPQTIISTNPLISGLNSPTHTNAMNTSPTCVQTPTTSISIPPTHPHTSITSVSSQHSYPHITTVVQPSAQPQISTPIVHPYTHPHSTSALAQNSSTFIRKPHTTTTSKQLPPTHSVPPTSNPASDFAASNSPFVLQYPPIKSAPPGNSLMFLQYPNINSAPPPGYSRMFLRYPPTNSAPPTSNSPMFLQYPPTNSAPTTGNSPMFLQYPSTNSAPPPGYSPMFLRYPTTNSAPPPSNSASVFAASNSPLVLQYPTNNSRTITNRFESNLDPRSINKNTYTMNKTHPSNPSNNLTNLIPLSATTRTESRPTFENTNHMLSTCSNLVPDLIASASVIDHNAATDITDRQSTRELSIGSENEAVGSGVKNKQIGNNVSEREQKNFDLSANLSNSVIGNQVNSNCLESVFQLGPLLPVEDLGAQITDQFSEGIQATASKSRGKENSAKKTKSKKKEAGGSHQSSKARRARNGIFSVFADSDTSSESETSEDEREATKKSGQKSKRWNMTRFLRSVILSESSFSDSSDNGEEGRASQTNAANSQKSPERVENHPPRYSASSSQTPKLDEISTPETSTSQTRSPVSSVVSNTPNVLEQSETKSQIIRSNNEDRSSNNTVENVCPSFRINNSTSSVEKGNKEEGLIHHLGQHFCNSKTEELTERDLTGPHLCSNDSNTLPKNLTNQNSCAGQSDATIPKVSSSVHSLDEISSRTHHILSDASFLSSAPTPIPQTNLSRLQQRNTTEDRIILPLSSLRNLGSPPTFYDNMPGATINIARKNYLQNFESPQTFYNDINYFNSLEQTRYDNVCHGGGGRVGDQRRRSLPDFNENLFNVSRVRSEYGQCDVSSYGPGNSQHGVIYGPCGSLQQNNNPTLYDNINLMDDRPNQTPLRLNQKYRRNSITDIEELKTGFEGAQLQCSAINVEECSDEVADGQIREPCQESRCLNMSAVNSERLNSISHECEIMRINSSDPNMDESSMPPSLYDNGGKSLYDNHHHLGFVDQQNQTIAKEKIQPNNEDSGTKVENVCPSCRIIKTNSSIKEPIYEERSIHQPGYRCNDLGNTDNCFDQVSQHLMKGQNSDHDLSTQRIADRKDEFRQRETRARTETPIPVSLFEGICDEGLRNIQSTTFPVATTRKCEGVTNRRAKSLDTLSEPLTISQPGNKTMDVGMAVALTAPQKGDCSRVALTTPQTGAYSRVAEPARASSILSTQECADLLNSDNLEVNSASATSLPLNKRKKPPSKLKKFFTSLLSLSTSDDSDDENNSSSSDSSGW